jgi:copper(I)-binding protein
MLGALALLACAEEAQHRGPPAVADGGVAIHAPAVPVPAGDVAALYFTVTDTDGNGDRLLGASCDAATGAMLHQTRTEGGVARMAPVDGGIAIRPDGELALEPGGHHVMLTGLRRSFSRGELLEVTLVFERAGQLRLLAPVVSADAAAHDPHASQ